MSLLQFSTHHRATPGFGHLVPGFNGNPLAAVANRTRTWVKRHSERGELARLTDLELRDFGVSRSDVYEEIRKPFWRA